MPRLLRPRLFWSGVSPRGALAAPPAAETPSACAALDFDDAAPASEQGDADRRAVEREGPCIGRNEVGRGAEFVAVAARLGLRYPDAPVGAFHHRDLTRTAPPQREPPRQAQPAPAPLP